MKLKKNSFKLFNEFADSIPQLDRIISRYRLFKVPVGEAKVHGFQVIYLDDKINSFLGGQIPELSLAERRNIRNFLPREQQLELKKLAAQVKEDITDNSENISDQSQLKRYLRNISETLDLTVRFVKEISRIDELDANNTFPCPVDNDKSLSKEQKQSRNLLTTLVFADNFYYYHIYRDIKFHIDWIQHDEGFIDLDIEYKIEQDKLLKQKEPIKTLEDAVINNDALNKIYGLLIEAKLIDNDTKFLRDKTGGKKGHFYSTILLFNEKGYFKCQLKKNEYLNICNNTFNADIKESTARNHKTRQASTLNIPPFTQTD